jgi:hypothetical protein
MRKFASNPIVALVATLFLAGLGGLGLLAGHILSLGLIALALLIAGWSALELWGPAWWRRYPRTERISTDPTDALAVSWQQEQWSSFQHKARFLRIQYEVRNRTSSPIEIENFALEISGLHFGMDPDISTERERLKRDHPLPPRVVPARGEVEGWCVVELEYGPGTGEPTYKLTIHSAKGGHEYGFRRIGNPKRPIPTG